MRLDVGFRQRWVGGYRCSETRGDRPLLLEVEARRTARHRFSVQGELRAPSGPPVYAGSHQVTGQLAWLPREGLRLQLDTMDARLQCLLRTPPLRHAKLFNLSRLVGELVVGRSAASAELRFDYRRELLFLLQSLWTSTSLRLR